MKSIVIGSFSPDTMGKKTKLVTLEINFWRLAVFEVYS